MNKMNSTPFEKKFFTLHSENGNNNTPKQKYDLKLFTYILSLNFPEKYHRLRRLWYYFFLYFCALTNTHKICVKKF